MFAADSVAVVPHRYGWAFVRRRVFLSSICVAALSVGPAVNFVDDWQTGFYDHGGNVAVGFFVILTAALTLLYAPPLFVAITRDARDHAVRRTAALVVCVLLAHALAITLVALGLDIWQPFAVYPLGSFIALIAALLLDGPEPRPQVPV